MGRYVFKPLATYFDGDPDYKKYEFIQAYKDSLTTGEIIVDLYNYDIYIANNGLEYPIPNNPVVKKEIINWIESDQGPLSTIKTDGLITEDIEDNSRADIETKKKMVEDFLNKIKRLYGEVKKTAVNDENKLLRMKREVDNWYYNLVYVANTLNNPNVEDTISALKATYEVLARYINLYIRLTDLKRTAVGLSNQIATIENNLSKFEDDIKNMYKDIVNNQISINNKLDKEKLNKKPDFKVKIKYNNNLYYNDGNNKNYIFKTSLTNSENPIIQPMITESSIDRKVSINQSPTSESFIYEGKEIYGQNDTVEIELSNK